MPSYRGRLCRICAATIGADCINILKTPNLKARIEKFLFLNIEVDDGLPKEVCKNCKNQLESINQLANIGKHTQRVFTNYFNKLSSKCNSKADGEVLQPLSLAKLRKSMQKISRATLKSKVSEKLLNVNKSRCSAGRAQPFKSDPDATCLMADSMKKTSLDDKETMIKDKKQQNKTLSERLKSKGIKSTDPAKTDARLESHFPTKLSSIRSVTTHQTKKQKSSIKEEGYALQSKNHELQLTNDLSKAKCAAEVKPHTSQNSDLFINSVKQRKNIKVPMEKMIAKMMCQYKRYPSNTRNASIPKIEKQLNLSKTKEAAQLHEHIAESGFSSKMSKIPYNNSSRQESDRCTVQDCKTDLRKPVVGRKRRSPARAATNQNSFRMKENFFAKTQTPIKASSKSPAAYQIAAASGLSTPSHDLPKNDLPKVMPADSLRNAHTSRRSSLARHKIKDACNEVLKCANEKLDTELLKALHGEVKRKPTFFTDLSSETQIAVVRAITSAANRQLSESSSSKSPDATKLNNGAQNASNFNQSAVAQNQQKISSSVATRQRRMSASTSPAARHGASVDVKSPVNLNAYISYKQNQSNNNQKTFLANRAEVANTEATYKRCRKVEPNSQQRRDEKPAVSVLKEVLQRKCQGTTPKVYENVKFVKKMENTRTKPAATMPPKQFTNRNI